jgi:molybdopterin-binding protein
LGLLYRIELNSGVPFVALLSRQECKRLGLEAGDQVVASFDPDHLLLVPDKQ